MFLSYNACHPHKTLRGQKKTMLSIIFEAQCKPLEETNTFFHTSFSLCLLNIYEFQMDDEVKNN